MPRSLFHARPGCSRADAGEPPAPIFQWPLPRLCMSLATGARQGQRPPPMTRHAGVAPPDEALARRSC
eukprot:11196126-Prorocentrum_lima.AAC.1